MSWWPAAKKEIPPQPSPDPRPVPEEPQPKVTSKARAQDQSKKETSFRRGSKQPEVDWLASRTVERVGEDNEDRFFAELEATEDEVESCQPVFQDLVNCVGPKKECQKRMLAFSNCLAPIVFPRYYKRWQDCLAEANKIPDTTERAQRKVDCAVDHRTVVSKDGQGKKRAKGAAKRKAEEDCAQRKRVSQLSPLPVLVHNYLEMLEKSQTSCEPARVEWATCMQKKGQMSIDLADCQELQSKFVHCVGSLMCPREVDAASRCINRKGSAEKCLEQSLAAVKCPTIALAVQAMMGATVPDTAIGSIRDDETPEDD